MRKSLLIHVSLFLSFLFISTVLNGWLDVRYFPYWLGGLIGFLLPDLDYVIYHYFLKNESNPTVNGIVDDISKKNLFKNWLESFDDRGSKKLIFHTSLFQLVFFVFALFVVTSSNSLLGRGIVVVFFLHLLVDQIIDMVYKRSVVHWFRTFPYEFSANQMQLFVVGNAIAFLLLGFYF